MEGELYACHYDFVSFLEPCTARAVPIGSGPSPPAPNPPPPPPPAPPPPPLPTGSTAAAGGEGSGVGTGAAAEGCTCEARSIARLGSGVDWDVGLSDAFIWFVFDLLLLSLLRVGGIRYAISHTELGDWTLFASEDRGSLI